MASVAIVSSAQITAIPQQIVSKPAVGLPEASMQTPVEAATIQQQNLPVQVTPINAMEQSAKLAYSVDQELGIVITKFSNELGQVIRQLPPEQIVNMYKVFAKLNHAKAKLNIEV